MTSIIDLPNGVNGTVSSGLVSIRGPKGELKRGFDTSKVTIKNVENKIEIKSKNESRKIRAYEGTVNAHIQNMINGVTKGYTYTLKIVYKHFPINAGAQGNQFFVKNFAGEKQPRVTDILDGVKVTVKGQEVIVEGIDKEKVGQTAANIETITRIVKKDRRRFQDGIFIVEKP